MALPAITRQLSLVKLIGRGTRRAAVLRPCDIRHIASHIAHDDRHVRASKLDKHLPAYAARRDRRLRSPMTAIALKLRAAWPSAIARNNAVRSAQFVGPYAAFSTLQP